MPVGTTAPSRGDGWGRERLGVETPWGQGAHDIPGPDCWGEVRRALPPVLSQHLRVGPARANTLEFLRKMKR